MIKIIPLDRSLQIEFSRTLSIDFDKVLKNCVLNFNRSASVRYIQDTNFTAIYKISYRPQKAERAKIRTFLYQACNIPEPAPEKRKKGGSAKTKTFANLTTTETNTISGFKGDLLTGFKYYYKKSDLKAKKEFSYE